MIILQIVLVLFAVFYAGLIGFYIGHAKAAKRHIQDLKDINEQLESLNEAKK